MYRRCLKLCQRDSFDSWRGAFASQQSRLYSREVWRPNHWRFRRRQLTNSCSESECGVLPSASSLLRQQRLLSGSWLSRKEGLFRISCSRAFSDGADGKNQTVALSEDGEKGAEHVLACDSGGEEDESDESRPSMNHDERARDDERPPFGNQDALFLAQKARFKKLFEKRVVSWEKLKVTFEDFPHYLR